MVLIKIIKVFLIMTDKFTKLFKKRITKVLSNSITKIGIFINPNTIYSSLNSRVMMLMKLLIL
jgi:hypothetical protein